MRRWLPLLAIIFLPWSVQAAYWDNIDSYDVNLIVQRDGSVDVREVITYDFGTVAEAHGIERFVPTQYTNGWFNDNIKLDLHSVTDELGQPWPVDTSHSGPHTVWRIGMRSVPSGQCQWMSYASPSRCRTLAN